MLVEGIFVVISQYILTFDLFCNKSINLFIGVRNEIPMLVGWDYSEGDVLK